MKTLLENWRRFLTESNMIGDLCLYHLDGRDYHSLILYKPDPSDADGIQLVGGLSLDKTLGKCITDKQGAGTYSVGSIYVEPPLQGKGFSKLLYGLAFHLANKEGLGVTSDQMASTSWMASERGWKKILNNPAHSLDDRETAAGNDVFDYDAKTKDPDDDCEKPDSPAPTNKSWFMNDHAKYKPAYEALVKNHEKHISKMNSTEQLIFHDNLDDWSAQGFENAYDIMKRTKSSDK